MSEKRPAANETAVSEFGREMRIMREVIVRRREALRQLALGEAIMDRDRDLLAKLVKS